MDIQEDGFPSDDYEFADGVETDGVLEGPRWVAAGVADDAAWVASKVSEAAAAVLMRRCSCLFFGFVFFPRCTMRE